MGGQEDKECNLRSKPKKDERPLLLSRLHNGQESKEEHGRSKCRQEPERCIIVRTDGLHEQGHRDKPINVAQLEPLGRVANQNEKLCDTRHS